MSDDDSNEINCHFLATQSRQIGLSYAGTGGGNADVGGPLLISFQNRKTKVG
jgi:hypothetical protein